MYEAGLVRPGSMAAVIGLDEAVVAEICTETGVWLANINCPGQLVISGAVADLEKAMEKAKERGASRVVPLQVSGAFHTPLMQPAVDGMKEALAGVSFRDPSVPVIGNTSALPITRGGEIKDELLRQLNNPVQWQRSVEYMLGEGVATFIEIGPGKVLSGLVKRISREAEAVNIGDAESVRQVSEK
jgi:[acyl-carrier-protein] S-malonyltransferase